MKKMEKMEKIDERKYIDLALKEKYPEENYTWRKIGEKEIYVKFVSDLLLLENN